MLRATKIPGLKIQIKNTTAYLDRYLATQSGGKLFMSIPGVGPRTSEAVLAYTDDVSRFNNFKVPGREFIPK